MKIYRKIGYPQVVENADTRFSNFAIECLREIEIFTKTVFCLFIWSPNLLNQKNGRKSRDTYSTL